jgi:Coatomer epsilon subunit
LVLKAQYEAAIGSTAGADASAATMESILDQMKALASSLPTIVTVQLCTAQVALMANETALAYQLLSSSNATNSHPECMALKLQIYIKIDRLDLAQKELEQIQKTIGEESVIVELCLIYVALATGKSVGADAEHRITTLCEQYGPSVYLLNLMAMAYMVQGNPTAAEAKLQECLRDFVEEMTPTPKSETLNNLCTVYHQQPSTTIEKGHGTVQELLSFTPPTVCSIQFQTNYERVTSAYDREAARYMTH